MMRLLFAFSFATRAADGTFAARGQREATSLKACYRHRGSIQFLWRMIRAQHEETSGIWMCSRLIRPIVMPARR